MHLKPEFTFNYSGCFINSCLLIVFQKALAVCVYRLTVIVFGLGCTVNFKDQNLVDGIVLISVCHFAALLVMPIQFLPNSWVPWCKYLITRPAGKVIVYSVSYKLNSIFFFHKRT
jgi:hypothetical protein